MKIVERGRDVGECEGIINEHTILGICVILIREALWKWS